MRCILSHETSMKFRYFCCTLLVFTFSHAMHRILIPVSHAVNPCMCGTAVSAGGAARRGAERPTRATTEYVRDLSVTATRSPRSLKEHRAPALVLSGPWHQIAHPSSGLHKTSAERAEPKSARGRRPERPRAGDATPTTDETRPPCISIHAFQCTISQTRSSTDGSVKARS